MNFEKWRKLNLYPKKTDQQKKLRNEGGGAVVLISGKGNGALLLGLRA